MNPQVVVMAGDAVVAADPASMVSTVTSMASTMLTTITGNSILSIPVGIAIAGMVVGLVWRLFRRH